MNNLISFEKYNINEAVKASLFKQLLKEKDKKAIDYLKRNIDLSKITDADVIEIKNPKEIARKPYSEGNYIVLVFGPNQIFHPGKDTEQGYVNSYYTKEKQLLYVVEGTDVYAINASTRGGKEIPSRRSLISDIETYNDRKKDKPEEITYSVYAIKTGEVDKSQMFWNTSDVQKIRSERNNRKANANFPEDRENYNDRYAAANRNRYSEGLKKLKDYSYLYDMIDDLMQKVTVEYQTAISALKYITKDDSLDNTKMNSIRRTALDGFNIPKEYFNLLKEFDNHFKFGETDKYNKMTLLLKIADELTDKLDPTHKTTEQEIAEIKALPEILKQFPLADKSDSSKYVNSNKWRDSDKLKGTNKSTGVLED